MRAMILKLHLKIMGFMRSKHHKFIEKCKCGASAMLPKIEKARQIRGLDGAASTKSGSNHLYIRRCCPKLNEDYGDTVPSRPFNNGLQVTNEVPTASTLVKQKISDGVELEGEGRLIVYVVPSSKSSKNSLFNFSFTTWSCIGASQPAPLPPNLPLLESSQLPMSTGHVCGIAVSSPHLPPFTDATNSIITYLMIHAPYHIYLCEFGTVIVHGGFEMDKTANQTPVSSTKEPSAAHENVESHPVGGPGIKSTNNWYFSSTVLLLFT
ncbi:hypothetical protein CK203_016521 [Vitis vinifera]|uniref:Uncharacterized protein n=1 Tax=Vitis vinifera TaxID=29760 RepID=A0A438J1D4_VITVI|nr:hypothetical protein CK203_016521 [Vitis vinifera]